MDHIITDLAITLLRIDRQDPKCLFLGVIVGINDIGDQLFFISRHIDNMGGKGTLHGNGTAHIHGDHRKLSLIQQGLNVFLSGAVPYPGISRFFKKVHPVEGFLRDVLVAVAPRFRAVVHRADKNLPTLCPFARACPAATAQSFRNLPFAGAGRPHQGQHRRSSDLLCLRSGCFHDLLHQRDKFRHGIYGQQPRHFGIPGLPHQHRILRLALQNIVDGIIQHNIKMDTILGTSQNNIFRWKLRELGHDLFCPHSHKMW